MTTLPGTRYDQYGFVVAPKGPRPEVRRGAAILMAGAFLHAAGAFLPWYQGGGRTLNGLDTFVNSDGTDFAGPGTAWIVIGALLLGLGAWSYFGRRHLAVAIVAIVLATIGLFGSLLGVGAAQNEKTATGTGDAAIGAFVGIIGILVAIAGAVQVLSKRRR